MDASASTSRTDGGDHAQGDEVFDGVEGDGEDASRTKVFEREVKSSWFFVLSDYGVGVLPGETAGVTL